MASSAAPGLSPVSQPAPSSKRLSVAATIGATFAVAVVPYAALAEALSGGKMAPGTPAALAVGARLLGGVVLGQLWAGPLVAGALATYADDTPAARLLRALELPGRVELAVLACHAVSAAATFGGLLALGE